MCKMCICLTCIRGRQEIVPVAIDCSYERTIADNFCGCWLEKDRKEKLFSRYTRICLVNLREFEGLKSMLYFCSSEINSLFFFCTS